MVISSTIVLPSLLPYFPVPGNGTGPSLTIIPEECGAAAGKLAAVRAAVHSPSEPSKQQIKCFIESLLFSEGLTGPEALMIGSRHAPFICLLKKVKILTETFQETAKRKEIEEPRWTLAESADRFATAFWKGGLPDNRPKRKGGSCRVVSFLTVATPRRERITAFQRVAFRTVAQAGLRHQIKGLRNPRERCGETLPKLEGENLDQNSIAVYPDEMRG
jgi:hypothetical protein